MAQDLRKMFEKEREQKTYSMKKGHEDRFLSKLEQEIPEEEVGRKSRGMFWLKRAASVVVLFALGAYFLGSDGQVDSDPNGQVVGNNPDETQIQTISLGDLSPDLQKIESYYLTNINLELSELEFSEENKAIIHSFMDQLVQLDEEYKALNKELNSVGPNDQTINALIKNLQIRLQLLQKLKSKLNQLKSSKNEQKQSNII
ncbi:hypothetical protein [Flagellimonas algicola]|uniref:Uncharacterized protein n=1 Tax=Flagellimonas algicola TaxID=2583815 RepID=A0ABY2WRN4_9FLAO|nr:hypothetical protein [Allomuricauda algicola]TMU57174.1 hypothetical protein FGG15_06415 [Allomuricauda algicola]